MSGDALRRACNLDLGFDHLACRKIHGIDGPAAGPEHSGSLASSRHRSLGQRESSRRGASYRRQPTAAADGASRSSQSDTSCSMRP